MIKVDLDINQFEIDMANILGYSVGFVEGVIKGCPQLLKGLGKATIESLKEFIDANARLDPAALHHVYEWYQVGSPDARLFDIKFTSDKDTISIFSGLRQSQSIQDGSNIPFIDKARIMEYGQAVTITPRGNNPLVFENNGQTIFTKAPVTVENPGGTHVEGSYRATLDMFFSKYFSQSFLKSSGIIEYIQKPKAFKDNLPAGKKGGRSVGVETGYKWIAEAGNI